MKNLSYLPILINEMILRKIGDQYLQVIFDAPAKELCIVFNSFPKGNLFQIGGKYPRLFVKKKVRLNSKKDIYHQMLKISDEMIDEMIEKITTILKTKIIRKNTRKNK